MPIFLDMLNTGSLNNINFSVSLKSSILKSKNNNNKKKARTSFAGGDEL